MKRICLISVAAIFFLLLTGSLLEAQTVERKSDLPVVGKSLSKLKWPADWYKLDGEWRVKNGQGGELDLRSIEFEGKEYYVLTKTTIEGGYRYPNLQMDYIRWFEYQYFLIDKNKLAEFLPENIEFNKSYAVYLDPVFAFEGRQYIEKDMYLALEKRKAEPGIKPANAILAVFPVIKDGKRWVRYFIAKGWLTKPTFDPADFDRAYYEAEYEEFYRFVNMGKRAPKYNGGKEKKN